jgi:hypothetical protein
MNGDEKFFQEKLRDYEAPHCPEELVDRIMARVDAEPHSVPQEKWWAFFRLKHALVPAAALAVILFLILRPSPQRPTNPAPEQETPRVAIAPPETTTTTPCELDLQEILRRLGAKDRAQLAYDDTTLCEAAEDVRTALTLVGKAMHSTERVLRNETRKRVADTVRMGLEASGVSPASAAVNPSNGG